MDFNPTISEIKHRKYGKQEMRRRIVCISDLQRNQRTSIRRLLVHRGNFNHGQPLKKIYPYITLY